MFDGGSQALARDNGIDHAEFLSANAERAYELIVAGEPVPDEYAESVNELVRGGFVTLDTGRGNRAVALNPVEAAQRRIEAMLREAAARVQEMAALPAITDRLNAHFERAQWRAGDSSEYLDDPAVINARLDRVVAGAEREILAAQPGGPRTEAQLNRSLDRDQAALARGVTIRHLYRATVRASKVTGSYVRSMSGQGAEFRTLVAPFERCIVVDGRTAFVSNHLVEGAPADAAWQITDRAMVAYITAEFRAKWRRADVWHGEASGRGGERVDTVSGPGPVGVRTTRRQREILREIASGKDQRVSAGLLGVSVRTLTGEIAELKALFDASSLPELAYKWALSPDRLVDDSVPAGEVMRAGVVEAA